ncbi:MAG: hypothetical protein PF503_16470 [Desulfobacula sp.]|jgi:enamine deaminase RidA (YjgF/YER057c/UK114 family)|nr:hypothetical protein [Desulfobacula sp.]
MSDIIRYGKPVQGGLPVSKAVQADGWLYVTGQVPRGKNGNLITGGYG